MAPRITVLVPTYNRADYLPQCIESLLQQTLPPAQVLVVDDGSTDNTKEVLVPFANRIEYVAKPNGGKSTALNLGLTKVQGDYVWIMDDDNVAVLDALERMVAPLERDANLDFTFSGYTIAGTRPDGRLELPGREITLPEFADEDLLLALLQNGCIIGGSAMFTRSGCQQAVPFDGTLVRSQDYDMALRIAHRFRGVRVHGPTFYYRQHEGERGSAADRFGVAEKMAKWREYNKKVVGKLRRDFRLQDYLPHSQVSQNGLSPTLRRRAYLQRMAWMGKYGMFDEALEDMKLAMEAAPNEPLTPGERSLIPIATSFPPSPHQGYWSEEFLQAILRTCTGPAGRGLRVELSRGLYWGAGYAWHAGSLRDAVRYARAVMMLLGVTGLLAAIRQKLEKRTNDVRPTGYGTV